ncbi:hypothetical protein Kpol_1018p16 [Vanderwaltozyma polyspora DSM 70294]|uniref:DNA repair protein RAD14 n=1 Tax=Vanderwaltozyma polyspora (strain ATCC 22028 / DSM 70294 / BCRC 21397 / CBS 2163 / NBRC 10782 / NRRL Y-8283 / UCD 57-17) TaxID=436907 RepID=A7TDL8_VANPO|nr:uncharacterized protein Kpol_1018p16 [Vanderwaltozyma polyspora DSM 70294]EDO19488.1 hypothetical protein Kpol_1018p16 [Vanderwaltozyma polyspora DSM 70294]
MDTSKQAKLEANRRRAIERLKQRGILKENEIRKIEDRNVPLSKIVPKPVDNANKNVQPKSVTKSTTTTTLSTVLPPIPSPQSTPTVSSNNVEHTSSKRPLDKIRPTIRTKDYIEYDFSTMNNLNGGYINPKDRLDNYESFDDDGNPVYGSKKQKTLDDWKREQQERRHIYENAPPPEHFSTAPKCVECNINIEMDPVLHDVFKLQVCKSCVKEHPEKYSLLTKTECKDDYFLTDPELNDLELFHRLEKPNPHSGTFARMQLFVRCEIEAFAFKKWGNEEGLDKEWQRREEEKVKRREKKYQQNIKEMRLKTRAQEFTNRLKLKKYGKQHTHQFSNAINNGKDEDGHDIIKRRCIDCGFEIEETPI